MDRLLAVGIVKLSDDAISAMQEKHIKSLRELIIKRDLGVLDSRQFSDKVFQELLEVCKIIDEFNEGLDKEIFPSKNNFGNGIQNNNCEKVERNDNLRINSESISDGRSRAREGILKDLLSISNLEVPTSIRKAILKIMIDCPNKEFDRKSIKKRLERKYKNMNPVNTDTVRSTLSSLESHMFIRRANSSGFYKLTKYAMDEFLKCPNAKNYFTESRKIEYMKDKELYTFISDNIGQEIEFRYKTDRAGSDEWWRRVRVHDQDDAYLYTVDYYRSGGRMRYLKENIIEYREVRYGKV